MPSGYESKLECKDMCKKRSSQYSWCHTNDGWGYCTEPLGNVIFKYFILIWLLLISCNMYLVIIVLHNEMFTLKRIWIIKLGSVWDFKKKKSRFSHNNMLLDSDNEFIKQTILNCPTKLFVSADHNSKFPLIFV